jgi:hypothetical protein
MQGSGVIEEGERKKLTEFDEKILINKESIALQWKGINRK